MLHIKSDRYPVGGSIRRRRDPVRQTTRRLPRPTPPPAGRRSHRTHTIRPSSRPQERFSTFFFLLGFLYLSIWFILARYPVARPSFRQLFIREPSTGSHRSCGNSDTGFHNANFVLLRKRKTKNEIITTALFFCSKFKP